MTKLSLRTDEEKFRAAARETRWFFIVVGLLLAAFPAYRAYAGVELTLWPEWSLLALAALFVGIGVFVPASARIALAGFLGAGG